MKFKSILIFLATLTFCINTKIIEFPNINMLKQQPSDPAQRLSSYPYISGDTFRMFCDFVIDKTNKFINPENIKDGDTIFIDGYTELLDFFFQNVHHNIKSNYILVTHNADKSEFSSYLKYLDDKNLIAWFGVNMTLDHHKTFQIPIGLANRYWKHGNIDIISNQIKNIPNKDTLIYVNIAMTAPARKPIYEYFASQKFCKIAKNREFKDFINDIARSKFVVSPPGNGIDCHRTWEAIYLGAIPLVEASKLDHLFQDLPVIIVSNWKTITKEYLLNKYEEIKNKKYNLEKIYSDYWFREISKYKEIAKTKNKSENINIKNLLHVDFDKSMKRGKNYNQNFANTNSNWKTIKALFNEHIINNPKYSETPIIPKIIHQIWLGNNGKLPEKYLRFQKTWIDKHPDWEYKLWTEKEIDEFGLKNRKQYDETKNYGAKADIARYEILYKFGGLYVDTDFECIKAFDELHHICDFYSGAGYDKEVVLFNGLIAAAPGHPILKKCVDDLKSKNCVNEDPNNIMQRTGPFFLTRCFFNAINSYSGQSVIFPLTYFYPWPAYFRDQCSPEQINKWINEETFANHHWFVSWKK